MLHGVLPFLSSPSNSRSALVFIFVSEYDTVGIWMAATKETKTRHYNIWLYSSNLCMLTAHPLSTLTVCICSRHVISCISDSFRCLLPLKSASRFFLCCGVKWREMVVVFSHFPNWSPASASNVNVLTVAIRNKTVIENMRLNSSTLRNVNNFHWALWPVMFQEVQKYSHFMARVHVYLIPHR